MLSTRREKGEALAEAIPGGVAAAWGVRERPHKGPKPALSLARIVAAAVRVADAEGLDAVSMGRVAAEVGTAPMSLYRHVASKEELLTLMVDAAWGEAPEGPAPGEGWRAGLTRWAWRLRTGARALLAAAGASSAAARPARSGAAGADPAGRGRAGGDSCLPDRLGARSMDQRRLEADHHHNLDELRRHRLDRGHGL